jgi:hypothetical protein
LVGGRSCAAGILVAVALAGCGGDAGPSRADFAKRADGVCGPALEKLRVISAEITDVSAGGDPGPIFKKSAVLIRRSQVITTRAFDDIDALDQPAGDRDAIKGWVADNRRQNALAGQLASAFDRQDQKRIALVSEEIDALNTKNNAFAMRFGMKVCAEQI